MIKSHYPVSELAAFNLTCLPTTQRGIEVKVAREGWTFTEVKAKGGRGGVRREYQPPAEVMAAIKAVLLDQALKVVPEASPSVAAVIPSSALPLPSAGVPAPLTGTMTVATQADAGVLKDWQRRTAEARAAILREIERLAAFASKEKAIYTVISMAADGTLPQHLMQLVPIANARAGRGGKRTLSRATIYEWFAALKGNSVNALAPKDQYAVVRAPAWASDLLSHFQVSQNVSLAWAVEQIAPKHGIDQDKLYHRANRFLKKMGNVERQVGRMGTRAIKNIKPFIRRDSDMLWPGEVYTADGHTFDAEIAHPAHGKPFRPEVTSVLDVGTRRAMGWSIDLAESGLAVLDALRHACETGGIPAMFYVDNGSGYRNAMMSQPGIGMESRLGFTMTHSIAYNSQARGVIERSHQTLWVRASKELPTYIGATMDAQAKQKVHKLTRRDVALSGQSKYLMSFNAFVKFCDAKVEAYNSKPHRGLPMIFDEALGKKRHMSPNEAWEQGMKDGAQLVTITREESRELFRPMKECKVLRGEVRLFNNLYFSHDLTEYHGDIVRVAYDIHNANVVWVYDQQGRFVSEAVFEANKRSYMPETALEVANRKRIEGQLRRVDSKRADILEAQQGTRFKDLHPSIENNPAQVADFITPKAANLDSAAVLDVHVIGDYDAPAAPGNARSVEARPVFFIESERYEWLMQHQDTWTEVDQKFLTEFAASDVYDALRERFEALDMAWHGDVFKVAV